MAETTEERFRDSAAYDAGCKAAKREYFEKVKSQEFWDAVVTEDEPEGRAYALQALQCIQNALQHAQRRKDG